MRALSDLASDFLELQNRGISAQDFMDDNDD
jgi:hypothetical protein